MRPTIYAAAASLAFAIAIGPANAMPMDHSIQAAAPSNTEQVQFIFGGRGYCWYDDGWHGPGFYWCGYAWRRGFGWGGGAGWHGWHRGGPGRMIGRPGHGPGMGRPGMGRP
ncbi:hypothetical protein, partial [Bradyrhizobium sp.]|uniref:hypothetical protein n=1 Tax=Bradyrhizobium sp. TaxID=376 RepID=UPI003C339AE6